MREAVSAPRIHHQWLTDRLMLEKRGFDAAMLDELRRRGHLIREGEDWGNANAIERELNYYPIIEYKLTITTV